MFNILHLPSNLTGVLQSNVINRVGTLYKLFLEFLLPIISGLIDFTKAFISKSEEQDKKIAQQQENLNVQDRNLRVMGDLLDAVKADLKNTKIKFDSSMKKYHENLDRVANEYRKGIDDLANKLIKQEGQDVYQPMSDAAKAMFAGNKTKKHKKHRRKVSK
jgi:ABC-type phosphate transport system auxiliary subunit